MFVLKFFILAFLVLVAECANDTMTKLPNGCVLIESSDENPPGEEMPRPFLNCSYLKMTSLDWSTVPRDIKSISLANNDLTTLNGERLLNFTSLKRLNVRHNKIKRVTFSQTSYGTLPPLRYLDISYNKLKSIPTQFLARISEIFALDLSGNLISAIDDDDFEGVQKITLLGLASNPLKAISESAWKNLTSQMYALSLQYTGLKEVPAFVSAMSKLIYLSLANNQISNVQKNAFYGAKSLRWLELASNRIQRLDRMAFAGTTQLRLVDLTDNLLETLPPGVFDSLRSEEQISVEMYENPLRCNCSLRWLKLWTDSLHFKDIRYKCMQPKRNHGKKWYETKLSDFTCESGDEEWKETCTQPDEQKKPDSKVPTKESTQCPQNCKCFDSKGNQYYPKASSTTGTSKKLRRMWWEPIQYPHVDCTNARWTQVPSNIRSDVKTLTLTQNTLKTLKIEDLKPFASLEVLDLEGCKLEKIVPKADVMFVNLTALMIHHNNITSFSQEHLKSFPNVKLLRMYHNKIQQIPRNMFSYTRKLNRLYIGPNPVSKFDAQCLNGLNLYSLSLRNMSITQIPNITARNLTFLELSDNQITSIGNNTFQGTPTLFRLALGNNRITTIGSKAFNNSSTLRYLDLSENRISSLPKGVFDGLNEDRLRVDLWMNRIYCDCNMKWFKKWIEDREDEDPMTEVRFMCSRPLRVHGRTSDTLSPDDFTCGTKDAKSKSYEDKQEIDDEYYAYIHGRCHTDGQLALAVILTVIFMLLTVFAVRCCLNRKRAGYLRYKPQDGSTAQLDMDM